MSTTTARQRKHSDLPDDEHIGKIEPESEPIVLTARDWEAFLAAWNDVDRPRPRLEALVRRYGNRRLSDVG